MKISNIFFSNNFVINFYFETQIKLNLTTALTFIIFFINNQKYFYLFKH